MTKVSDVYDKLETIINNTLSDYAELPNPYTLEFNTSLFLKKGYGLAFGGGRNTNRSVCQLISTARIFSILLVNLVTTTANNAVQREAIDKALLEDSFKIVKAIENDSDLSGSAAKAIFLEDSGVEFIDIGENQQKFVVNELTFEIEYFDTL